MQLHLLILVLVVNLFTFDLIEAQISTKLTLQSNSRRNRGLLPSAPEPFNGYNYPAPTNGLQLPPEFLNQNSGFAPTTSRENSHENSFSVPNAPHGSDFAPPPPLPPATQPSQPHPPTGPSGGRHQNLQQFQSTKYTQAFKSTQPLTPIQHLSPVHNENLLSRTPTSKRVQTIRVIHEDRTKGHHSQGGNIKTVRIVHQHKGHSGGSNNGKIQTVQIIRNNGNSYGEYTGHDDTNVKTVKIVQDNGFSSSSLYSKNPDNYRTFKIIQENSPAIHSHVEESKNLQLLESPVESYSLGENYQTVKIAPDAGYHHNSAIKTIKLIDDIPANYENSYGASNTYKIIQDSNSFQYTAPQSLETINLFGSTAISDPNDYKTVKILQDNLYNNGQYATIGGLDGIWKVVQYPGYSTGNYDTLGTTKLLSILKK